MHKFNKAFVFRMKPTKEQDIFFRKNIGCSRFIFNKMLEDRISIYEKYKDDRELLKKQNNPTPAQYKKEFPFLKEVDSLALANAQINLNTAYKNFFWEMRSFLISNLRRAINPLIQQTIKETQYISKGWLRKKRISNFLN